jgi:hypothetical protein
MAHRLCELDVRIDVTAVQLAKKQARDREHDPAAVHRSQMASLNRPRGNLTECSGSRYWPDAIADIIRRLRDGDASDLGGDAPGESGPGST